MKLTKLNQRLEAALRDRMSRLNPMTRQLLWWIVILIWAVLLATPAHGQDNAHQLLADKVASLAERSPSFAAALDELGASLSIIPGPVPDPYLAVTKWEAADTAVVIIDVRKARRHKVDDWDAILAHEVYGHALAGRESCRDPEPGQSYLDSCVGKREAEILIELGRSPRLNYSF